MMPQPAPTLDRAEPARSDDAKPYHPGSLPGEDGQALAALRHAVAADWRPRDAYERHWVEELVAAMARADRLRRLEIALLDAALADPELALAEATVTRLATFARYGARLDADLRRALRALEVLKERPAERVAAGMAEPAADTREPAAPAAAAPAVAACTFGPEPSDTAAAPVVATCTFEPEPSATAAAPRPPGLPWPELRLVADGPGEPAPPAAVPEASPAPRLNRKARRRQQALRRQAKRS